MTAQHKPSKLKIETFADHHVITPPDTLRGFVRRVTGHEVDDPIARAEKALASLAGEFQDWMAIECDRLAAAHAAIMKDGFNAATRDELFRAAHDIKGDAATFGFPAAGAAADSLCRLIEHAPELDRVPAALIGHHIDAIQAIVREQPQTGMAGNTGMADELSRKLRGMADDYLARVNRGRPEHLEAILAPGIAPAD